MEADFRDLLAPPPEQPEISNINNVLSIQPLPQAPLAANEYVSHIITCPISFPSNLHGFSDTATAIWMRTMI